MVFFFQFNSNFFLQIALSLHKELRLDEFSLEDIFEKDSL